MNIMWAAQDLINAALDRLRDDRRWQIVDLLMAYGLSKKCRGAAYSWAYWDGESFFEVSDCNLCRGQPYTYCRKPRPGDEPDDWAAWHEEGRLT